MMNVNVPDSLGLAKNLNNMIKIKNSLEYTINLKILDILKRRRRKILLIITFGSGLLTFIDLLTCPDESAWLPSECFWQLNFPHI